MRVKLDRKLKVVIQQNVSKDLIFRAHIQPKVTHKYPPPTLLCSFRFTVTSGAVSTMCRSSPRSPPGHGPDENCVCVCVCVCVTDFLSSPDCFKLNVNNMIWMPVGLYRLRECGVCVPLRICYNLMIERWDEAVKAGGISCTTLGLKA